MFDLIVSLDRTAHWQRIAVLLMSILLGVSGCAKAPVRGYLKRGITPAHVGTLAVLPFDNISGHPDAGKKVVNLLLTELARAELFEIAEAGEIEKSLRRLRIRTTAELDLAKLQELGQQINARTVIVGSVDEYEVRQERAESIPIVAVNARMLDTETGDILWAASHVHDGDDWETVFGFGKITSLSQLAKTVISEMVESLVQGLTTPQRPGQPSIPYRKTGRPSSTIGPVYPEDPYAVPSLTLEKKVTPPSIALGQTVTFDIIVSNTGRGRATNVVILDKLPPSLKYKKATDNGILDAIGHVRWQIDVLRPNETKEVKLTVMGFTAGRHLNEVTVSSREGAKAMGNAIVTVVARPAIRMTMTVRQNLISVGKNTTYAIVVENKGAGAATGVLVVDSVPKKMKIIQATSSVGTYTIQENTITFNIGTIEPGEKVLLTVHVKAIGTGNVVNSAELTLHEFRYPMTVEEPTTIFED